MRWAVAAAALDLKEWNALGVKFASAPQPKADRLVIVPDAHGDAKALRAALALADANRTGTQLVSLGDSVDRGPDPLACYAELARHSALCMMGNHDWFNIQGIDERDDPRTPDVRENFFAQYVSEADLSQFGGWKERREAFGPTGTIGRAIRENFHLLALLPNPYAGEGLAPLSSAATLLMHAGIKSQTALRYSGVAEMAKIGREALEQSLSGDMSGLHGDLFDELLWDRGLAYGEEKAACADLAKTLEHLKAARLVVGHTPQERRRALVRCQGRLVVLDVAMSRWLMNMQRPERSTHAAAIELQYSGEAGHEQVESFQILYEDKKQSLHGEL